MTTCFKKIAVTAVIVLPLYAGAQTGRITTVAMPPAERIKEITAMLPDKPRGLGEPIEQRTRWDSLYRTGLFTQIIREADSISKLPFPKLTEQIYMEYYKGEDSQTSKLLTMKRRMLLTIMVWAECLTNKGKYMPAINAALNDIVNARSWTFPAEDRKQTNYEGKLYTIGLSSSAYGMDMAQTLYLLRSKLSTQLQEQIATQLRKRVFDPVMDALRTANANGTFNELTGTGNHTAVELAGVTIAALTAMPDKTERATFVAMAERYSNNYLLSYLSDGYCTEGLNYYCYGFGHYLWLREAIMQATKGRIDLLDRKNVNNIAMYAPGLEIMNNVYPTISDCEPNMQPWKQVMYYINKAFKLDIKQYDTLNSLDLKQRSLNLLMLYFPNYASAGKQQAAKVNKNEVRHYFKQAGVLSVRPQKGSVTKIGANFKGGHNAEQHNHNDVGSYTIAVGDEMLSGDPGLGTYTPKYFTKERYKLYKTPASYGHPVPLIAGVQQHEGRDAQAKIIKEEFTPEKDVLVMDIKSAYAVDGLDSLTRTFTYNRASKGQVEVIDYVAFAKPQTYETAIITRAAWKQINSNTIQLQGKKEKMLIKIEAPEGGVQLIAENITEPAEPYARIGIKLNKPLSTGTIKIVFTPL